MEAYGWELVRIRGSHHTFRREDQTFTIPSRRPRLLAVYVRGALDRTEEE
ncbi:MAG: type II toxin-antitoxin system HicA family toxin [Chloroflexota bacterium]|nr:MAG: type II toxin-antitoxin system HicA family toxin [Chloroflexota bacterium]